MVNYSRYRRFHKDEEDHQEFLQEIKSSFFISEEFLFIDEVLNMSTLVFCFTFFSLLGRSRNRIRDAVQVVEVKKRADESERVRARSEDTFKPIKFEGGRQGLSMMRPQVAANNDQFQMENELVLLVNQDKMMRANARQSSRPKEVERLLVLPSQSSVKENLQVKDRLDEAFDRVETDSVVSEDFMGGLGRAESEVKEKPTLLPMNRHFPSESERVSIM